MQIESEEEQEDRETPARPLPTYRALPPPPYQRNRSHSTSREPQTSRDPKRYPSRSQAKWFEDSDEEEFALRDEIDIDRETEWNFRRRDEEARRREDDARRREDDEDRRRGRGYVARGPPTRGYPTRARGRY